MDWFSRYVLAWQLSNTLDSAFCIDALRQALQLGKPAIFNSDQGVQFTATAFTSVLEAAQVQISMDGRGRAVAVRSCGSFNIGNVQGIGWKHCKVLHRADGYMYSSSAI